MKCGRNFPFEHPAQHWAVGVPGEAILWCQSLLKQIDPLPKLPDTLFRTGYSMSWILCIPNFTTPGFVPESLQALLVRDSRKIHSSWLHTFYILSYPDWLKGYCMNNLRFNLFKTLLLFRIPLEIIPLPCQVIERAYNLTLLWNMDPPKNYNA